MPEQNKLSLEPESWVDEHGDYLLGYACNRLNDRAAAEDAVQETFLAAIRGLDRFDGRCNVRYWLLGILKHKIVDHIRKASREMAVEDTEDLDAIDGPFQTIYGIPSGKTEPWKFNPRKMFEQREFWEVFTECISRLQGRVRMAYTLHELEGLSTEEACKVLQVKSNHLWVLLHRARAHLRPCLKENWILRNKMH
jgi:RNA polymerase sigma-70 factor (ECF subfamily)